MQWITTVYLRLKALLSRRRFDSDLEDEMAFHLGMREHAHRTGAGDQDIRFAARKQFGNVARITEACREMRTFASLETFWQDVRYGARGLRKNPGLTLVVVVTLAVGVGASSWVFAMLKQWVIDAVAFPHPEQIVVLWELDTKKGWTGPASAPDYLDWKENNRVLESLSAWTSSEFNLNHADAPQRVQGSRVSANLFHTLDVRPEVGRDFLESDAQPGAGKVVIVSHGLWRDRLHADPDLTTKTLTLEGEPYSVVGVMPDDFHFTLMGRANLWVPLVFTDKERADRGTGWLQVIGRLKPGVTQGGAGEALNVIARGLEKAYPETNTDSGVLIRSLTKEIGQHVGDQGIVTGFVVGVCILLIACSNIAGIYLARTLARRKEMTMRLALGARRSRLARQLLSENILLLPAAIGLGLVIAKAGANWVTAAIPYENRGYLPNYGRIFVDSSTLVYTLMIAAVSLLLFSLAPIVEGYKLNLTGVLKEQAGGAGFTGQKLRKTLVIAEIVLALTALVPAGLETRSLMNLLNEDPGFRPDHVLTARLSLPAAKYQDKVQWKTFYDRLLDRLRALPQVQAASASQYIPFGHHNATLELWIEGRPEPAPGQVPATEITSAYPGYLPALGMSLLRGRFLSEQDTPASLPVIVINRTMERRYFGHDDALGHRIRLGRSDPTWYTVVGVVKDVKLFDLGDRPENESYIVFAQSPERSMSLVLRTSADPLSLSAALRNALSSVDKELPISDAETMEQRISNEEAPFRIFAQFSAYFALLAVFLAGMGIYGVMAYLVASRTREIGIRMACGAEPRNILWLVLAGSLKLVTTGVLLGLTGAWAVARLLSGLLHGVSASDPGAYALSVAVMVVAILLASFIPVRRATKVDPMLVLRYE
ncbi:MAG TPA: ABC transporter permease [Candidatus Angelobacter sp.]